MRKHPAHLRARARELYEAHGPSHAARETGISLRTIQEWANLDGWTRRLPTAPPAAGLAPVKERDQHAEAILAWHTRKRRIADHLGRLGSQLMEAIEADLAQRKRLNLRDAGILLGIILDKAELLAPLAGGELEARDPAEVAQRVDALLHTFQERREAAGGEG